MATRREFVARMCVVPLVPLVAARALRAQTVQAFSGPMEQDAYLPVKLAPKPSARASMSDARRDDLEHMIKCQCGCPLDVFTCRTTDFSCAVSPAMHADVMSLVDGGYSGPEILRAFESVYGERVLMEPVKSGFNWLGYGLPSFVVAVGALVVASVISRWRTNTPVPQSAVPSAGPVATDDELARIADAVRHDE